jgi:hypothetical protein
MFELGDFAEEEHRKILDLVRKDLWQMCMFIGDNFYDHRNNYPYLFFKTLEDAKTKFELLNNQVAECQLFLSDTNITVLRPLPLSKIQDELPVAALDAKLFPVKVKDADAAQPGQEVVIMTAYERVGKLFSAYMIVEYRFVKE